MSAKGKKVKFTVEVTGEVDSKSVKIRFGFEPDSKKFLNNDNPKSGVYGVACLIMKTLGENSTNFKIVDKG